MIKINHILVLSSILFSYQLLAQNTSDTILLNEDKTIEIAFENNLKLKNSKLLVQIEREKKALAFDLPKTQVNLDYGQLNSIVNDRFIAVNQEFEFPTVYYRELKLATETSQLALLKNNLFEMQFKAEVLTTYVKWHFAYSELNLANDELVYYQKYKKSINAKYNSGEINYLAKLMAESKLGELELNQQRKRALLVEAENELKQLLQIQNPIAPIDGKVFKLPYERSIRNTSPLIISLAKQELLVEDRKIKAMRSKISPAFSVGYFNQSIDLTTAFTGWQFGVGIPLFFWSQKSALTVAKLKYEITSNTLSEKELAYKLQLNSMETKLDQLVLELGYYESQALHQAQTILEHAGKSFDAGNINYLEYLQAISNSYSIQNRYLIALNKYNQATIEFNYLIDNL
ncbi:MAG: TolC family protein [Bacteroidetes bacterium]|nr:TolC family protein [Bacteroidota bacterium]